MDPFHPSRKVDDAHTYLKYTAIESLIEENISEPVNKNKASKEKQDIKYKDKINNDIPRSYLRKPITTTPQQIKKVETVGEIRRRFEAEAFQKWIQILKSDEGFAEKCILSKYHSNKLQDRLQMIISDGRPITKFCWDTIRKLLKNEQHTYIIADGKRTQLAGCVSDKRKDIKYVSFKPKLKTNLQPKVNKNIKSIEQNPISDPRTIRKRGLLSTINLGIKPGPLSKKTKLNSRNQGLAEDLTLMHIPSVGLEVFPHIGTKLDNPTCMRLNSIRRSDGYVDEKWARFASSVLETDSDNNPSYTFAIPYENNQNRVLFRRDPDFKRRIYFKRTSGDDISVDLSSLESHLPSLHQYKPKDNVEKVVKNVVEDILKCISISEVQDSIGSVDIDYVPVESKKLSFNSSSDSTRTNRKNRELSRLDVTVIDVSDDTRDPKDCKAPWCKLGCICLSLKSSYMLNEHCGRITCMLDGCTCKFGKNEDYGCQHEIPKAAVANLQHHMNKYLAKEEQKFRRTVIKTKNNTIVIGAARRGQRLPKKYDDFIVADGALESKENERTLSTVNICLNKLPPDLSIQPFCMVHFLYKCFCKGVMTSGTKVSFETNLTVKHDEQHKDIHKGSASISKPNTSKHESQPNSPVINTPITVERNEPAENTINVLAQLAPLKTNNTTIPKHKAKEENMMRRSNRIIKKVKRNTHFIVSNDSKQKSTNLEKDNVPVKIIAKSNSQNKIPLNQDVCARFVANGSSGHKISTNIEKKETIKAIKPKTVLLESKSILKIKTRKELVKDAITLLLSSNKKLFETIPDTITDEVIVQKWSQLIENFQTGKIFLWVTEDPPYRVFAATTGKLFSKLRCLPIVYGKPLKKNIVLEHSSLKYILCCDSKAFSYVAFVGKKFAWELLCSFSSKPVKKPQSNYPVISSVCGSYSERPTTVVNIQTHQDPYDVNKSKLEESKSQFKEFFESIKNEPVKQEIKECESNIESKQKNGSVSQKSDLGVEKPIYHWLLLHIKGEFNDIYVEEKKFQISYKDTMKAMTLAENTGKTCKYPTGPLLTTQNIPEFGAYAIPGNQLSQIFLGPCKVGEKMVITMSPKNVEYGSVQGVWTRQLSDPRLIVWRRGGDDDQAKDRVLFLGKPFTTLKLSPKSQVSNQNIFNYLRLENKSDASNLPTIDQVLRCNVASTSGTCKIATISDTRESVGSKEDSEKLDHEEEEDDDIVYIPNDNSIIELSDVEDD